MSDSSMIANDAWMEIVHIQEKLAEARHNEKFGWAAVIMSAVLVTLPSMLSAASVRLGTQAVTRMTVASEHGRVLLLGGLDLAAGLFLLAGLLVVLGVAVALHCRFLRSRLFDELKSRSEAIQRSGVET